MKKIFLLLPLFLILIVGFSSCDKIKEKIFSSFIGDGGSIDFTIDPITSTANQSDQQELSIDLDIDGIIREYTNGVFGLNSIDKVSLESAELIINNPDANNNLQNLESFFLAFNTNTSTEGLTLASSVIDDQYADRINLNNAQGVNLIPYLGGTQLSYLYQFKARRATTKPLNCTIKFKFKFE